MDGSSAVGIMMSVSRSLSVPAFPTRKGCRKATMGAPSRASLPPCLGLVAEGGPRVSPCKSLQFVLSTMGCLPQGAGFYTPPPISLWESVLWSFYGHNSSSHREMGVCDRTVFSRIIIRQSEPPTRSQLFPRPRLCQSEATPTNIVISPLFVKVLESLVWNLGFPFCFEEESTVLRDTPLPIQANILVCRLLEVQAFWGFSLPTSE